LVEPAKRLELAIDDQQQQQQQQNHTKHSWYTLAQQYNSDINGDIDVKNSEELVIGITTTRQIRSKFEH